MAGRFAPGAALRLQFFEGHSRTKKQKKLVLHESKHACERHFFADPGEDQMGPESGEMADHLVGIS